MSLLIDCLGLACPLPVIKTKKQIQAQPNSVFDVCVDNQEAVENLRRLAKSLHYHIDVNETNEAVESGEGRTYLLHFSPDPEALHRLEAREKACDLPSNDDYIILFDRDRLGVDPKNSFGRRLISSFIYSLTESSSLPKAIIFYDRAVFLTTHKDEPLDEHEESILADLGLLAEKGVELMSCGLCLDNYQRKGHLQVGEVGNMYQIIGWLSNYRVVKP